MPMFDIEIAAMPHILATGPKKVTNTPASAMDDRIAIFACILAGYQNNYIVHVANVIYMIRLNQPWSVFIRMRLLVFCALCICANASPSFYDYRDTYPFLNILKHNRQHIKNETLRIIEDDWRVWPETYLYANKNAWKVFPFYGFGFWVKKNCLHAPILCDIIEQIPNVKTASLSRLAPGTKLTPHQGWAALSNHVLRCHYGIDVPDGCSIGCDGEIAPLYEDDIVVFDDSKMHYAENKGDRPRIVLILDIERPNHVPKGESCVEDTDELTQFIQYMKDEFT